MCDKDWAFFSPFPCYFHICVARLLDLDQKSSYLPFDILRLAHHDCALISQPLDESTFWYFYVFEVHDFFMRRLLVEHFNLWMERSWNGGLNVIHTNIPSLHQNFEWKQSATASMCSSCCASK